MNMLSFPSTKNPLKISTPPLCSFNFKPPKASYKPTHFHARDRVIDFGKHKGKKLGTLPSTYLKWVSSNLRARDFEEWAKLAAEVLEDEVYRDRIEWEFAEKLLDGGGDVRGSVVDELVEISLRFGWDNEDKLGWRKIDFGSLGTSNGGRIPRLGEGSKRGVLDSRMVNNGIGRLDKGRQNGVLDARMVNEGRKRGVLGSRMVNKGVGRLDGSRKGGNLDSRSLNEGSGRLDGGSKRGVLDSRMVNNEIGRLDEGRKNGVLDSRMVNKGVGRLEGSRKGGVLDSGSLNDGSGRLDGSRKSGRLNGSRKGGFLDSRMANEGIGGLDGSGNNESLDYGVMNEGIGRLNRSRKGGFLESRMINEGSGRLDGSGKIESLDNGIGRLDGSRKIESLDYRMMNEEIERMDESRQVESLDPTMMNEGIRGGNEGMGETRKERRERLRSRRSGGNSKIEFIGLMEKIGIEEKNEGRLANSDDFRVKENENVDDERGDVGVQNKFPGRDGLLRKVLSRRTSF